MDKLRSLLTRLFGASLFIGFMAVGYYYNLTFVQLGLVDLGQRVIGMSRSAVAGSMAVFALVTCLVALAFGLWISRRTVHFKTKLRLVLLVVLAQTLITPLAQGLRSPQEFQVWILGCSLTLGFGVPVTFSLGVDLVPRGWRGTAAAAITGLAYLAANTVPAAWTIEDFTRPLVYLLPAGVVGIGMLAFLPLPIMRDLGRQGSQPNYAHGRYIQSADRRLFILIVLMFGVYFVDSLGFLRLLETPRFMDSAWQSLSFDTRLVIGLVHVLTAVIAGILYDALNVRSLFYWIFGIFALSHLMYTFSLRFSDTAEPLATPLLYATAVSLYTVVNFAVWIDLSNTRTIWRNAALGVALSGWAATFFSTALAIAWETSGMPLEQHLNIVDSLAILFLLGLMLQAYLPGKKEKTQETAA